MFFHRNSVIFYVFFCTFIFSSSAVLIRNHLRIGLAHLPPYVIKNANNDNATGFLVDLIQNLLHRVNTSGTQQVTYEFNWIPNGLNPGNETAYWDAVRDALNAGNFDLVLAPLVDTKGWTGLVRISRPYLITTLLPLVLKNSAGQLSQDFSQRRKRPIFVRNSETAFHFEKDTRNEVKSIYDAKGNDSDAFVDSYEEGVRRVSSTAVLFGEQLRLEYALLKDADLCQRATLAWDAAAGLGMHSLPISLYVTDIAVLLAIDTNLLRMRQDGTVRRLKALWWKTENACSITPPPAPLPQIIDF